MRRNLLRKLRGGETLFPGILGYDESVVPQVVNAILSRHNMILLGPARPGQEPAAAQPDHPARPARSPMVAGLRDPRRPAPARSASAAATSSRERGDETPLAWLTPDERYVEKLATPDVTIADIIGDVDPIRAARGGHDLASELTMHYGLLPRAHRGIFALNELPDLAGRIQVGPLQHPPGGRRPDQGLPGAAAPRRLHGLHRQPRGLHRARQDHHARSRTASAARSAPTTRPPSSRAWPSPSRRPGRTAAASVRVPRFIREVAEGVAFAARRDKKIDKRSGVSQRLPISALENAVSNAERRALRREETPVVPRVSDVYAALPVAHRQVRARVRGRADGRRERGPRADPRRRWARPSRSTWAPPTCSRWSAFFEAGGSLQAARRRAGAEEMLAAAPEGARACSSTSQLLGVGAGRSRAAAGRGRASSCSRASTARRRSAAATTAASWPPSAARRRDIDLERLERLRRMKKQVN